MRHTSDDRRKFVADVGVEVWRRGGNPDLMNADACWEASFEETTPAQYAAKEVERQMAKKREREQAAEALRKRDEVVFVRCPSCGREQADLGRNVLCEGCREATMPWYDENNVEQPGEVL